MEVPALTKVYQECATGPIENGNGEQKMFHETREATNLGQIMRVSVSRYT